VSGEIAYLSEWWHQLLKRCHSLTDLVLLLLLSCIIASRRKVQQNDHLFSPGQERCEIDGSRTFDDTGGADLGLGLFIGFFELIVPNSSELVVVLTAFPLK
jgi:hypothetical protein